MSQMPMVQAELDMGGSAAAAEREAAYGPAVPNPAASGPAGPAASRTPVLGAEAGISHGVPEAVSSLMRTIVVALFVLTFLVQPMVIPSESMERTLLVGDFLLMNRSALAPAGFWRGILPYAGVERGEIVVFHSPLNPKEYLVKRAIGLPGDRIRIDDGQVLVNGHPLDEPYAAFEPTEDNPYLDHFPGNAYTDFRVDTGWWKRLQQNTRGGEMVVPAGEYFMLGDNRNHSLDSRYWGFVARDQIVARPLVIYFSLVRPSRYEVQEAADDRLGHDGEVSTRVRGWERFARWKRIFRVVR